jgi:micrococcal nuclease
VTPETRYVYACVVVAWTDGDTVVVDTDLGFRLTFRQQVRLYGVNAPELHGPTAAAGQAARAFAEGLAPPGTPALVQSFKSGREKYGRWLAAVTLPDGRSVSDEMVKAGHAEVYLP